MSRSKPLFSPPTLVARPSSRIITQSSRKHKSQTTYWDTIVQYWKSKNNTSKPTTTSQSQAQISKPSSPHVVNSPSDHDFSFDINSDVLDELLEQHSDQISQTTGE